MDRSDVIFLIKEKMVQNDFGQWVRSDWVDPLTEFELGIDEPDPIPFSNVDRWRSREVFCDVRSITRTEWFEAGRNGIEHPEFIFVINRNEYDDEKIVQYNDKIYGVYRTYEAKNENLELYVEAKGGLHESDS